MLSYGTIGGMTEQPHQLDSAQRAPFWRRALAYWWYAWGLSWCQWGLRSADPRYFRSGVRAFDRSIRVWPSFAAGVYRRGLIRGRELNQPHEAITDLTRAIALAPEWPDPYLQRGLLLRYSGSPEAAADDLRRFIALAPGSAWHAEAERQLAAIQHDLAADH